MNISINLKRSLVLILTGFIFLSLTPFVFAQEEEPVDETKQERPAVRRVRTVSPSDIPTRRKADVQNLGIEERNRVQEARTDAQERKEDRQENREERTRAKEERVAEREEKKEERKALLSEKRKDRIKAFGERIIARFGAAIERLEKLAERIDSRIEKLEERGLDLTQSKTLLEEARANIESAKASVLRASSLIEEALSSDDPKEAFKVVREILGEAKDSIKLAHQSLVAAIREIKVSLPQDNETDNSDKSNSDAS